MTNVRDGHREDLIAYQERMMALQDDLNAINRELGQQDLLGIASRTRELLRRTKALMDGNVTILFADQPARVYEELYKNIDYAQGHIEKALGEEYDFDAIKKRLYMATKLAQFVINGVGQAVGRLHDQYSS